MNHVDAARLVDLHAQVAASQVANCLARQHLIERLGDHMCGNSESGLTRAELKMLARARQDLARAKRELAQFLTSLTMASLVRTTNAITSRITKAQPESKPLD